VRKIKTQTEKKNYYRSKPPFFSSDKNSQNSFKIDNFDTFFLS